MGKGYCQHGCYPVDKRWHGGSFTLEIDGEEQVCEDIFDFRKFILQNSLSDAEEELKEQQPADEPYVLPEEDMDDQDPAHEKIKRRGVSISNFGNQAHALQAYSEITDQLATFYKFDLKVVKEWYRAKPQSQLHDEMVQRRQQAEQQINRVLSNLQDLYEQKQLLEHDKRRLEERQAHFEADEESELEGEGYEDELKADFVDLVDQHTGRHSILQMQANNIFPSITADFYQMSGLDDLREGGQLAELPENEKAVLRKKWKLYQQWKEQFRTAVQTRLQDVNRRLNSVQTSIEQTEQWIKPYVEDIQKMTGTWEEEHKYLEAFSRYLPRGYADFAKREKMVGTMDRSPGEKQDKYHDVVIMEPIHFGQGGAEQPQAPGQGLVVFYMPWTEYLCCNHVYEELFQAMIDRKTNQIKNYIAQYIGDAIDVSDDKAELREKYGDVLTSEEEERIEEAETEDDVEQIELDINDRLQSRTLRWKNKLRGFFGVTDDFYHEDPQELRRKLLGPYFPTQFYLDYKYDNDLYVMK